MNTERNINKNKEKEFNYIDSLAMVCFNFFNNCKKKKKIKNIIVPLVN